MLQPYIGIVGDNADTAPFTELFYDKVTPHKQLHRVAGASHVDLYDVEPYVTEAVEQIDQFFKAL